jgi:hypothetical protein
MAVKFANLASTTLASGITNSATSITVADASSFPALGSGDYFYASIGEGSVSEIIKVTAISLNTFTAIRGRDNTTAGAFSSGTVIALRVVAAALDEIATAANGTIFTVFGRSANTNVSLANAALTVVGRSQNIAVGVV